jgi:hypothetical protein
MKFKELLQIEVMVLRTWEHGFRSIPGRTLLVFQCFRPLGLVFEWFFCGTLDRSTYLSWTDLPTCHGPIYLPVMDLFVWRGRFVNPAGDGPSTR